MSRKLSREELGNHTIPQLVMLMQRKGIYDKLANFRNTEAKREYINAIIHAQGGMKKYTEQQLGKLRIKVLKAIMENRGLGPKIDSFDDQNDKREYIIAIINSQNQLELTIHPPISSIIEGYRSQLSNRISTSSWKFW